jgi:hypothetical protein
MIFEAAFARDREGRAVAEPDEISELRRPGSRRGWPLQCGVSCHSSLVHYCRQHIALLLTYCQQEPILAARISAL